MKRTWTRLFNTLPRTAARRPKRLYFGFNPRIQHIPYPIGPHNQIPAIPAVNNNGISVEGIILDDRQMPGALKNVKIAGLRKFITELSHGHTFSRSPVSGISLLFQESRIHTGVIKIHQAPVRCPAHQLIQGHSPLTTKETGQRTIDTVSNAPVQRIGIMDKQLRHHTDHSDGFTWRTFLGASGLFPESASLTGFTLAGLAPICSRKSCFTCGSPFGKTTLSPFAMPFL